MLSKTHILVVEDDPSLAEWISDYLIEQDFSVSVADRGDTAIELIELDQPDLVVLDLMLPGKSGFEVCKHVRDFYRKPILMLTAREEESDEILGLEYGADDYLTKPVRPRRLLARINALLRRDNDHDLGDTRTFGSLQIDAQSKTVKILGEPIALSANEFDLLWVLAKVAGETVSRIDLTRELRGLDYDGFDRSIDIRISRLRKKLGDNGEQPTKIKTIRGKGYLFAADAW